MFNGKSQDENKFRNFLREMKDGFVRSGIDSIGSEFKGDDEQVLLLFILVCNTPLIFDLFKKVIVDKYCGDSHQIEEIIDELKNKTEIVADENNLKW